MKEKRQLKRELKKIAALNKKLLKLINFAENLNPGGIDVHIMILSVLANQLRDEMERLREHLACVGEPKKFLIDELPF